MADLLPELNERIKALAGDWSKYSVVGSFLLYVAGYLALRFHLTAIGIGTDLSVLDERYLFAGARFLVYFVSSVPNIVLLALPAAAAWWAGSRLLPARVRARIYATSRPAARLTLAGIFFCLGVIQLVMRQCFFVNNLLLADVLPQEPAWLIGLLLDDELMPLFFSALVAACLVPIGILLVVRGTPVQDRKDIFARGLLAFLLAVQLLFLPILFGVLIIDKTFARVAAVGSTPVEAGGDAWLAWEGKEGITFLLRSPDRKRRSLVTLQRDEVKKVEIIGFDRIVPALFGTQPWSTQ